MKLLEPGGVNIGGHHVSYGLLAVILAVPVAFLAIRQFGQGGGATAGADPNAMGTGVYGGDQEAAISNLNQLIDDLTGKVAELGAAPPPATPPRPHPGVSDALFAWRLAHHYGQDALYAPTTRSPDLSRTA